MPWRTATTDWRHAPLLYRVLHRTIRAPLAAAGRVQVRGDAVFHTLGDRGALVASNHGSGYDPVAINAMAPRPIHWLAKREVFEVPIFQWFVRGVGSIRVDRQRGGNVEALDAAVRALTEERRLIGVFVEGTRDDPAVPRRARGGVARLALLTGAPVIPVGVLADHWLPKGRALPRFGQRIYVNIGAPVEYGRDPGAARDPEAVRKVADDVYGRIRDLLPACFAARERGEEWGGP